MRRHQPPTTGRSLHRGRPVVTRGGKPRNPRRTPRLAALLLTAGLVATACSGGEETSSDAPAPSGRESTPAGTPGGSEEAPPAPQRWPLTGEKLTGRLPDHRAVVVKIENTASSEPQLGLGSADVVVEELVEGGLTRLAAVYHSSLPAKVGPVRSLRGTDIGIVKPTKGVLVSSGGAPPTMRRVRRAHIITTTEGTKGYYRVGDRPAPYNLFANLRKLPKAKLSGPAPDSYLPWGSAAKLANGKPARQVTARFSAGQASRWTWTGKSWRLVGGHAAPGDRFVPENVLALRVRQTSAGYRDPAGNPVPESVLTGKGAATLFHEGKAYQGTWVKKSNASPLRLVTAKGQPLPVPPGRTWVELIPASGGGGLQFGG